MIGFLDMAEPFVGIILPFTTFVVTTSVMFLGAASLFLWCTFFRKGRGALITSCPSPWMGLLQYSSSAIPTEDRIQCMMTSWNGNIFRITGHLCGEFTGPRWIPHTKASDAELWCFLCRRHFQIDFHEWKLLYFCIQIPLTFAPIGPIKPPLVQTKTWCRIGDEPLSEPMMTKLQTHMCGTRPQWLSARLWYLQWISTLKHSKWL